MTDNCIINTYEAARKKQLEENRRRFEDLGILKISRSLSNSGKKSQLKQARPKLKSTDVVERRCSSRAPKPVTLYHGEVDSLPPSRKRSSRKRSTNDSSCARPLAEIKTASNRERARAISVAEKLRSNLQSQNPSFIKSMLWSHVYCGFWLGLPTMFCEDHLPKESVDVLLEDENGAEYKAKYLGNKTGLSGGWRAFALNHKLDDGDALVFELIEPMRFKIYTIKAATKMSKGVSKGEIKSKVAKKSKAALEMLESGFGTDTETKSKDVGDNGLVSQELSKKGISRRASKAWGK